jgi:hypothetical protein
MARRPADSEPHAELPELMERVAELTSREVAVKLMTVFGGVDIVIPRRPRSNGPLAKAIGLDATKKLCAGIGHGRISIPIGRSAAAGDLKREIQQLLSSGKSVRAVALELGIHLRTVWRVRAAMKIEGLL